MKKTNDISNLSKRGIRRTNKQIVSTILKKEEVNFLSNIKRYGKWAYTF